MNSIIKELQYKLSNNKFVIACSTGPDSMCLVELCKQANLLNNMIIAHVNHGLREESNIEEEYITSYCKESNIILEKKKLNLPKSNIEAVARQERYNFFQDVCNKYDVKYLLLGHNADDNLETILMRLIKGSSLAGYSGIKQEFIYNGITLYRPLINKSKQEILDFNDKNNVKYFIDKTNLENDFTRSRIRNTITPLLKEENPNWINAVKYYSESIDGANSILFKELERLEKEFVIYKEDTIIIKNDWFLKLDIYIQKELLFDILKQYKLSLINIQTIFDHIYNSKDRIITNIIDGLNFIKEYDYFLFTTKSILKEDYCLMVDKNDKYNLKNNNILEVNENICYLSNNKESICYNSIKLPFIVRNYKDGDKIKRISKEKEYYQKISNILTTLKLPYLDRINTLVIEKDNEVVAILGLKIK